MRATAYSLVHRLLSRANTKGKGIAALHQAHVRLGTLLEMQQLATMMGEGIQAAFDQPPLAIYCQRNASDHQVELTVAHTLSAGLGLRPGMGLGRERPSAAPWSHRPP